MPEVPGGVSGVFSKLMPLFFGDDGRDFSRSGCQVKLPNGECLLIFCDIAVAVADEAALHHMYGCKGSGGVKNCCLCINVYNRKYGEAIVTSHRAKRLVYHTEEEIDRCKFATTDVILAIIARLASQRAVLSNTAFGQLETDLGWNYDPAGIMCCEKFNRRVCPTKILVYDFCHVLFVNGVFNLHGGKFLAQLKRLSIRPETIGEYVMIWTYPHHISAAIKPGKAFGTARLKSSMEKGQLKCSASEGLSLLPVLAHYCEALLLRPSPAVRLHAQLFLDLAKVVGQIIRSGRKLMSKAVLHCRVTKYIKDYKATYGEAAVPPKFHMLGHLSKFDAPQLPNCFVHERKHKTIKRFANQVFGTSHDWDASVLREVTSLRLERLAAADSTMFSESAGLVQPRSPSQKMMRSIMSALGDGFDAATIMTSRTARVNRYEHASIGDLVLVGHADPPIIGRVVFHISIQVDELVEFASLIEEYDVGEVQNRAWKCRLADRQTLFDMQDIVTCLTYAGTDVVTVLKPLHAVAYPDL